MKNNQPLPLDGLDPAGLLKQGVAEDTITGSRGTAFSPPPLEMLAPLFPQFEFLEIIGQGGMGAVYKVRQRELDRLVALKILPPSIGLAPGFADRFAREAKALAKLNHPGIVTIHEFGQVGYPDDSGSSPLCFILMEFVDGVNLSQLIKMERISPRVALAIVPQICDALQFAHDHGIVHRDIKPENILLDRLGRVKVADFGIAKVIASANESTDAGMRDHGEDSLTVLGKVVGTPQYMAPEQKSTPGEVDHRADIYALGVVFYQMLTGELPGRELRPPSQRVLIDVRLDEIVMQALDQSPELRFQKASVMKTKVEELAESIDLPTNDKSRLKGYAVAAIALIGLVCLFFVTMDVAWRNEQAQQEYPSPVNPVVEMPAETVTVATPSLVTSGITVHVLGEVANPGTFRLAENGTLLDAVAAAGGWVKGSDLKKVSVKSERGDHREIYSLKGILEGSEINPSLEDKSVITIKPAVF